MENDLSSLRAKLYTFREEWKLHQEACPHCKDIVLLPSDLDRSLECIDKFGVSKDTYWLQQIFNSVRFPLHFISFYLWGFKGFSCFQFLWEIKETLINLESVTKILLKQREKKPEYLSLIPDYNVKEYITTYKENPKKYRAGKGVKIIDPKTGGIVLDEKIRDQKKSPKYITVYPFMRPPYQWLVISCRNCDYIEIWKGKESIKHWQDTKHNYSVWWTADLWRCKQCSILMITSPKLWREHESQTGHKEREIIIGQVKCHPHTKCPTCELLIPARWAKAKQKADYKFEKDDSYEEEESDFEEDNELEPEIEFSKELECPWCKNMFCWKEYPHDPRTWEFNCLDCGVKVKVSPQNWSRQSWFCKKCKERRENREKYLRYKHSKGL